MKRHHLIWAVALVGAVFAVYHPALRGPWLWDDGLEITGNPMIKDPAGWWLAWGRPSGMDYFPLKDSLLWLEWHAWGDRPAAFHLVSIALHAANALLIWKLLSELGLRGAWFGALIFALHPVAVESVAWVAEQKTGWSLAFGLCSVLAFLRWERSGGTAMYAVAVAAFAAALLAKSTLVPLPVALLGWRWWRGVRRIRLSDAAAVAPFFALSAAAGLCTVMFQWHRAIGVGGPIPAAGPRCLQAAASAAFYLKALAVPADLAPIYPPAQAGAKLFGAVGLVVGSLIAASGCRRTWGGPVLVATGWAVLMLLPVLGFIPMAYLRIAPRADHLAYAALVGFAGLAAWAIAQKGHRVVVWAACAAVAGLFGWSAHAAAAQYADAETFWAHAVARNERAWLAQNNLGQLLLRRREPSGAAADFEAAVRWGPPSAEVHANLGAAYDALGRTSEARQEFERAVALDPQLPGARYDLGRSLLRDGRLDAAVRELGAAVRLDPGHAAAHNLLGLAYARLGAGERAAEEYRRALVADPSLPEAHVNLGNWLARSGALPAAIAEYRRALEADPQNAAARLNLEAAERYLRHSP